MKYTFFTFLCLVMAFTCGAQHFNQRYTLNSRESTHIFNAVEKSGRYLAIGSGYDSSLNIDSYMDTPTYNILLLDASGNIARDTLFTDTTFLDVNFNHPIFPVAGGYIVAFESFGVHFPYFGLMRVDSMGNILSRQLSPLYPSGYITSVKPVNDTWLTLSVSAVNGNTMLTRWDSALNIMWSRTFNPPITGTTCAGWSVAVTANGYLLAENVTNSSFLSPSTTLNFWFCRIIQTDTVGNIVWYYDTPHEKLISSTCIVPTSDNGVIYCGAKSTAYVISTPYVNIYDKGWIQKLDSGHNIAWSDSLALGTSYNQAQVTSVKELPDHSIIAAGYIANVFDASDADKSCGSYPFLAKYSGDGTVIWKRKYRYLQDSAINTQVFDLQTTSDGGFLIAVNAYPSLYSDSQYAGWLIKVDSNGYAEPGHEFVNVPETNGEEIAVYPNPSAGQITIDNADQQLLRIIDAPGRELRAEMISGGHVQLNVGELPSGNYFFRFCNTLTGSVAVKKVTLVK